jgi:hypothetical protein
MEKYEGSFVVEAPVDYSVRPTLHAHIGPNTGVRCDLPHNIPAFFGL